MRMLLLAAAAALGLAGCTTTQNIDVAIQQNLPAICSGAATLHVSFIAVAETGAVKASIVKQEEQAWTVLAPLCVDPSKTTSTTVLVAAANAYLVISRAIREAKEKSA